VFGRSPTTVANYRTLGPCRRNAAWTKAKLAGVTPHEARHVFASLMIAAGVNAKALSTFMGHSSITITLDRYGHLMTGDEAEAAGLLDDYLARAVEAYGGPLAGQ
jgi:integrase